MTQIALDAEIIPLNAPRLDLSMELKEEDMSGQTSGTDGSEQGDKGIVLSVTGLIPFKEAKTLKRLMVLSRQKEGGKRKIYRIGNELAKSMTIRQVRFVGRVTADEQERLMSWKVSFQLREHLSVSEVKEQREQEKAKEASVQSNDSTKPVKPKAHAAIDNNQASETTTRFEQALKQQERELQ
ncbi:baseplate complex protein [Vibrio sagamiensis]|uniref:Uncharacterized protein n=1 Tax=Vibrio sagamiensis NBRC 104589 TaxID=1219064 RepID=A0A511QJY3_9VIBR|nr:hypothetical protein [Vibrio sagamiensis]PNQ69302.1 hypothetical protein C1141_06225 [Vibrio agarivorans]GEM77346.1 hypothetical protein VSA01S_34580 [Vibrio sagamiensis NBRC 104589]